MNDCPSLNVTGVIAVPGRVGPSTATQSTHWRGAWGVHPVVPVVSVHSSRKKLKVAVGSAVARRVIARLQIVPGHTGTARIRDDAVGAAVLVAGPAVDELHRDLVRDVISVGTGRQVRPAPVLEDPEPGVDVLPDRAIREMERDGGWIARLRDHDFVVEQACGEEDAGGRRGIRRDRHGMDVPEDRPWRRLDGHLIVELAVAVDIGGRDHGDTVALRARGRTCRCGRRRAVDRVGGRRLRGGRCRCLGRRRWRRDQDSAMATGSRRERLASGDADWLGFGLDGRLRSGLLDGSGAGACDGSGCASADGWPSCCDGGSDGSWATTEAGTMTMLASSSAVCSRTTPLKRARARWGGCVT